MNILAVDTTRKQASIFLMGEKFNKWHMLDDNEKQSEFLMLNIDRFLKENSLDISDIIVSTEIYAEFLFFLSISLSRCKFPVLDGVFPLTA